MCNYRIPLIGQKIDTCLYFTSLEQLSDPMDGSDDWYLLEFHKSWAIIWSSGSVRWLMFACILQVLSNYRIPLIGQIIDTALYFARLEQLSDPMDWSDDWYLLGFYNSWAIIWSLSSVRWYLLVLYRSWAIIGSPWSNACRWIDMYKHGYTSIYIYIYIYIYSVYYIHIYIYIYIYVDHAWIYMHSNGYTRIYVYTHGYSWTYLDMQGYLRIYIDIHGYISI